MNRHNKVKTSSNIIRSMFTNCGIQEELSAESQRYGCCKFGYKAFIIKNTPWIKYLLDDCYEHDYYNDEYDEELLNE